MASAGPVISDGQWTRFVGFLRQDLDAVTAGSTLPRSSGVEGHVNRVNTLKGSGRRRRRLLRPGRAGPG
ncbi:hypothetical protein C3488_20825 [Streptomyces sp. Ru72]|nr:hypothetical protein C3488_20825 [Streptomyces sp. Ru72]